MPSKITLRCPGCKARITAPAALLGRRRNCPGCATSFVVRTQPPTDSDPLLVSTDRLAEGSLGGMFTPR